MKKTIRSLMLAGAVAVLATQAANAQILVDGYYVKAGVGPSFLHSLHYKNGSGQINSDPGVRLDFMFGCDFSRYFAAEVELGGLYNGLDTDSGQRLNGVALDAWLDQYPILGNLIFKLPMGPVTPYIGAGAGGVASTLQFHTASHYWAYDTDFTFAAQAMAGLDFKINDRMNVGVSYKFFASADHSWFGDNPALFTHTSEAFNHSVLASFTYKF